MNSLSPKVQTRSKQTAVTLALGILMMGVGTGAAAQSQSLEAAKSASVINNALTHIERFQGRSLHGADQSYKIRDVLIDADGASHTRFDRHYKGLRVLGGDLIVHGGRQGALQDIRHTLRQNLNLTTKPGVSANEALRLSSAKHGSDNQGQSPELMIYARGDQPRLAWEVRAFSTKADGTPSEMHVIVDAHTGAQLDAWDDIHTGAAAGTGKSFFSGNVALTTNSLTSGFELRDPTRGNQYTLNMKNRTSGGTIFTDADNVWGNNTVSDTATIGVDAQYGTAVTWDYYKNVHGRNGIANDGKGAYNRVHYSRNYNNAYWSDSCFCMTYGDGDGTRYNPFDSLDVAGHEMTHGVTSRTANLTYSGESGGLNEATSDIFGTMVEFYANNASDPGDYLIGERLPKAGGYLRSMIKPSADGASADCWYSGVGSLDVHYSSGVANHLFFILAEGTNSSYGQSPTCVAGNTRVATGSAVLTGIGRDAAAKIWYRALTTKMTSNTNYAGARAATLAAAAELVGTLGTDYSAKVAAAWSAVGVN
ncbi:M4 family metallopeptidase [Paucibacter sp. KCTC 42545]|uniref:M4 family metallopeptidase n=1 Tax=Paucibacter sp. KCTC 42545 TaxID=1768242 RepID=UPI000733AEE7|nr:M4 family metallopeptidase [Paucibacter sp. KCTC 42545]ALT76316.1 peptidase [Paucibacter sp. KCTC 42545]